MAKEIVVNQKGRKTTTWPLSMKVVHASGSVAAGVNMLEPALHLASPGAQQDCCGRRGKPQSGYGDFRKAGGVENFQVTMDIVVKR